MFKDGTPNLQTAATELMFSVCPKQASPTNQLYLKYNCGNNWENGLEKREYINKVNLGYFNKYVSKRNDNTV